MQQSAKRSNEEQHVKHRNKESLDSAATQFSREGKARDKKSLDTATLGSNVHSKSQLLTTVSPDTKRDEMRLKKVPSKDRVDQIVDQTQDEEAREEAKTKKQKKGVIRLVKDLFHLSKPVPKKPAKRIQQGSAEKDDTEKRRKKIEEQRRQEEEEQKKDASKIGKPPDNNGVKSTMTAPSAPISPLPDNGSVSKLQSADKYSDTRDGEKPKKKRRGCCC